MIEAKDILCECGHPKGEHWAYDRHECCAHTKHSEEGFYTSLCQCEEYEEVEA